MLITLAACDLPNDLLVDPAPESKGRASVQFNLMPAFSLSSRGSTSGPADRVWIRLSRGSTSVIDTIVQFPLDVAEMRVRLDVETVGQVDTVQVTVELREGDIPLSRGLSSVVLTSGNRSESSVRVVPIERTLAAGGTHTCAIAADQTAYCWGYNNFGQVGIPLTTAARAATPTRVSGSIAFRQITAGDFHTCGLTETGEAYCWGSNSFGQLGNGSTSAPFVLPTPQAVVGGHRFRWLSAGGSFTCGISTAGAAYCWGENTAGQLGNGSTTRSANPVAVVGGLQFRMMDAGIQHACGIVVSGAVHCWGDNRFGQLGDASTTSSLTPTAVSGDFRALDVQAGMEYTCALALDGGAFCWGSGNGGKVGNGSNAPILVTSPAAVLGANRFTSLSGGLHHNCAIADNGTYCWGLNWTNQVGDGTAAHNHHNRPFLVPTTLSFRAVAAGNAHTCALSVDGSAYCWGDLGQGQVGNGAFAYSAAPTTVSGGQTFTAVAAGSFHSCALTSGGAAYCWGRNNQGGLGIGTLGATTARAVPTAVSGNLTFRTIDVSDNWQEGHTCAITTAGAGYCWGDNRHGQLGDGSQTRHVIPTVVSGAHNFQSISAGSHHSCGVVTAGDVYCWGWNGRGQLGNGSTTSSNTPVRVSSSVTFVRVTTAFDHTCAVSTTGLAYCWGSNRYGQLGDGSTQSTTVPRAVTGSLSFSMLSAAGWGYADEPKFDESYTCGLAVDGTVYCWGTTYSCRIGNGDCSGNVVAIPTPIAGGRRYVALSTGISSACAVANTGQTYCWGGSGNGELGTGSPDIGGEVPVQVATSATFTAIAVSRHGCAVTAAGSAHCWGPRSEGMLGDGMLGHAVGPTAVAGGLIFR